MAKRNFSQLQKSMTARELNSFAKRIAMEYAYSDVYKATMYFTDKYNISRSCYGRVKDYAVTHFLVSDDTIKKMIEKAQANQKRHSKTAGGTTIKHYDELMAERRKYALEIVKEYIENPQKPVRQLAEKRGITDKEYYSIICFAFEDEKITSFEQAKEISARMSKERPS